MTHEPGRERHMTYRCEYCGRADRALMYLPNNDHYICEECYNIKEEANDE